MVISAKPEILNQVAFNIASFNNTCRKKKQSENRYTIGLGMPDVTGSTLVFSTDNERIVLETKRRT